MKKSSGFLFIFMSFSLFLFGCNCSNEPQLKNNSSSNEDLAYKTIREIASIIGKDESDIEEKGFYWESADSGELDGYYVKNDNFDYTSETGKLFSENFDGWSYMIEGDGMRESYVEYVKEDIVCGVHDVMNGDLEYLTSLMYDESENAEESNSKLDELLAVTTYTIEIQCAQFNEQNPSPLEFNFKITGEEPFWSAYIMGDNFRFSDPYGESNSYYTSNFKREGNILKFKSNDYFNDEDITGELIKSECIDGGIGKKHEYTAKIYIGDVTFQGCADKRDSKIFSNREGKFSELIKEIGYKYTGKLNPEKLRYSMYVEGDLIQLYLTNEEENVPEDEQYVMLILGQTDNGFETYWEGDYNIDDETCEKYVNVEGLMDFSAFYNCPRG